MCVTGRGTIFALATAQGRAGVGIVRISGPETRRVLQQLLSVERAARIIDRPRMLVRADLIDRRQEIIDSAMVVFFSNPHSFTGEDVAELHIHSSQAVISALYAYLSSLDGVRLAEPGEFSRRAFLHSKLDLAQVEGLGDLLAAETESQRRLALRQLGGHTSAVFSRWRAKVIKAMAMVEAWIDFSEDEAIESDTLLAVRAMVEELAREIEDQLEKIKYGEMIRNGLQIALCGPPNAGKSSLLNMLVQRDAAIVSPLAGTTRDILQVSLQAEGHPLTIMDTAGMREAEQTGDPVEVEGIKRALKAAASADLVLFLIDASTIHHTAAWRPQLMKIAPSKLAIVLNKTDLMPIDQLHQSMAALRERLPRDFSSIPVLTNSCVTGTGLRGDLLALLKARFFAECTALEALPVVANERQQSHVRHAQESLHNAQASLDGDQVVLAAEHLRQAAHSIGHITGHIGSEDILDVLFSSFCIGK